MEWSCGAGFMRTGCSPRPKEQLLQIQNLERKHSLTNSRNFFHGLNLGPAISVQHMLTSQPGQTWGPAPPTSRARHGLFSLGILTMRFQLTAATSPTFIQTQGTQVKEGEEATR